MTIDASVSLDALSPIASTAFGLPADPSALHGAAYAAPHTLVAQTVYLLASKVFAYTAPGGAALLDGAIQLWRTFHRTNADGIVPNLTKLDVRGGAANALLGYHSQSPASTVAPIPVLVPGSAWRYMQPTLAAAPTTAPLAFSVAALDYDETSGALVADYTSPTLAARALGYPVLTLLLAREAQHMLLLTLALAAAAGPAVNVYDGPLFLRSLGKIAGVLSQTELAAASAKLQAAVSLLLLLPVAKRVEALLAALNLVVGTSYKPFEYTGHASPDVVFVVHGSVEHEVWLSLVLHLPAATPVGVVSVRVALPFDAPAFALAIPAGTRTVVVVGQLAHAGQLLWLKGDVLASLFLQQGLAAPQVAEFTYVPGFVWSEAVARTIALLYVVIKDAAAVAESGASEYVFWAPDNLSLALVPARIAHAFSLDELSSVEFRQTFDNINGGGVAHTQVRTASAKNAAAVSASAGIADAASVVAVADPLVLKAFDVVATSKLEATVLITAPAPVTSKEEFVAKLPRLFVKAAAANGNKVVVVDPLVLGDVPETGLYTALFVAQVAFWLTVDPLLDATALAPRLREAMGSDIELLPAVLVTLVNKVNELGAVADVTAVVGDVAKQPEEKEEEEELLPIFPVETAFAPNPREGGEEENAVLTSLVVLVAKKLAFKEAYGTETLLRPDLPVRNFVVKVQENRRVTPELYDRNIFHIEFDISGTGLTYAIGEALGVHGRNPSGEVEAFLALYGLDPNDVVEVPSRDDALVIETRTVFQTFTENLDLLGKPGKGFFEQLAAFATKEEEKTKLEFLASGEGAAELKRFQEEEFYLYLDVLELFPLARPLAQELVRLIAPLKRREYLIALSQKMHPNAVHLLVVVVDWVDKRGRKRFGHCSKYLLDLAVGTELVVSVKPSVMKLPKLPLAPVIMSGLGTGLAPFKAFVEEKAVQRAAGIEIGPMYLYLGLRHQREEYLYGELWEAYKLAGILTHIGAAFLRDQPEKIYIQDRIRENIGELTDMIVDQEGSFYLCGPTWPVPDLTACLEDVVSTGAARKGETVDAAHEVEEMKETGRYVLEVY